MKPIRVAINGFGRIGRAFARLSSAGGGSTSGGHGRGIEIVAVNDLGSLENLAYLLKYDTVYGRFSGKVAVSSGQLVIDGKEVKFFSEKDPANLPWKDLHIDVVVESTGFFTDYERARAHITAGARRVVITAPSSGVNGATVLMGINEEKLATCQISSNASCTTNAASPVLAPLN